MFVIRLPNGNLMVPESAMSDGGQMMADAYVEIGPGDADYARFAAGALTEEEAEERRRQWQEGDATAAIPRFYRPPRPSRTRVRLSRYSRARLS